MALEQIERRDDEDLAERLDQLLVHLRKEMDFDERDGVTPLALERHQERIDTVDEVSRRLFRS